MDLDTSAGSASDLATLTADIVGAYVSNNAVAVGELVGVIASVHAALARTGQPAAPLQTYEPAVPIKKSLTPEALISLIDGKPYQSLKRHLTRHGLTPADYRARYGLPSDYPMTAAAYSARRSALAKSLGLGQQRRKNVAKASEPDPVVQAPAKKRTGWKAG